MIPIPEVRSYGSPSAFRAALKDRLLVVARTTPWELPQLQRQLAYDRLLERLYRVDEGWIVKGATALLARDIGVRATIDVDLFRRTSASEAETELRAAASQDLGDWFRFEVGAVHPVAASSMRLPVSAFIGGTLFVPFHVDLVGPEIRMTGEPDRVPALARVDIAGVEQHGYRAYPLVDHVADKVVAIFERYGRSDAPSTRFKDLVDLVAIALVAPLDAAGQLVAVRSEAERRSVELPDHFDVPDRASWERGYAAEARRSLLPSGRRLDEALVLARALLDPVLDGTARGRWVPADVGWQQS